jgi:cysteinyl-tRNA synthetase
LLKQNVYAAMNDDFNTPVALAHLFEAVRIINSVNDGKETLSEADKQTLKKLMHEMVFDILGLREEQAINTDKIDGLMQMILEQRKDAKARKDFASSDLIRDKLKDLGFEIKDGKDGTTYSIV